MSEISPRAVLFRQAITAFIDQRRIDKLGDSTDPAALEKYQYATWLEDAARRVKQIQSVTHVLKATHPDARGTNLHVVPNDLPQHSIVGSHVLGGNFAEDVVGNAAALDVYKFLKIEVEGKRLLDWMRADEVDLRNAMSDQAETATEWMQAFTGLIRADIEKSSHAMAKQVYWLTGENPCEDNEYHLLQPLFSSSLAQVVYTEIKEARFGEANKNARQARRNQQAYDGEYRDYPGLVVRKMGGTKPQNISQLNSDRGGINYLLASLPPRWKQQKNLRVLGIKSAFESFFWFEDVKQQIKNLAEFLKSDPKAIKATRDQRQRMEETLADELLLFVHTVRNSQTPGWTRSSQCYLPLAQRCWLDPYRNQLPLDENNAEDDMAFNTALLRGDWPEQVAAAFSTWLNERLRENGLLGLGDSEHKHWAKQAIMATAEMPAVGMSTGGVL